MKKLLLTLAAFIAGRFGFVLVGKEELSEHWHWVGVFHSWFSTSGALWDGTSGDSIRSSSEARGITRNTRKAVEVYAGKIMSTMPREWT